MGFEWWSLTDIVFSVFFMAYADILESRVANGRYKAYIFIVINMK